MNQRTQAGVLGPEWTTRRHADRDTPLVNDCWYVAAFSDEVGRKPLARLLLERPVALFRRTDREVVALHDRCAHRSMPLSQGRLEGDQLVCAYHGFTYDSDGRCVRVPSEPKTPKNVCVPRFPVVERQPFIWIWLGDPAKADPALIPDCPWFDGEHWGYTCGYTPAASSYIRLHENLLDLTHFTFLHPNNVGTPEYAAAPYRVDLHGNQAQIFRELKDAVCPPLYGYPMGLEGRRVERSSDSWFHSPAFQVAHAKIVDPQGVNGGRRDYLVKVIHAITPQTRTASHYFWAQARDFAQRDERVTRFTRESLIQAFVEDKVALEEIERTYDSDTQPDFFEMSVGSDRAGLHMRRVIQQMALAEYEARRARQAAEGAPA